MLSYTTSVPVQLPGKTAFHGNPQRFRRSADPNVVLASQDAPRQVMASSPGGSYARVSP